MEANINEVVTLIDFLSAGMNRVNLVETKSRSAPQRVDWYDHFADLERSDRGFITSLSVDGHRYDFTVDTNGVVTDVRSTIAVLLPRGETAFSGLPHSINMQTNAYMLDGRPVEITSFAQPTHGTVSDAGGGFLVYQSQSDYSGTDAFAYQVGSDGATVNVQVVSNGLGLLPDIWWPLDDAIGMRAVEFSTCQAFGTLINGPSWITEGRWRGALSFDGTDDYVTAGTKPSLSGIAPFSLAAWVRTHGDWSKDGVVIQQRDWAGYNGEYVLLLKSDGRVSFLVYGEESYQFNFASTSTVNDHQWHHIVAVRDGAAGHIYIDGVLAASASGTVRPLDASIGVALGADVRDNAAFFNGDLDDIRIYNRPLSVDDIRMLCDQYRPRSPRFVDLTRGPGGDVQFQLADTDVMSYVLLASTDLLYWCEMPGALQHSGGVFRVTGSCLTNQPQAFFRLKWP